jgi:hypothetical protein
VVSYSRFLMLLYLHYLRYLHYLHYLQEVQEGFLYLEDQDYFCGSLLRNFALHNLITIRITIFAIV